MNIYLEPLKKLKEYQKIKAQIKESEASVVITGTSPVHKSGLISLAQNDFSRDVLVITADSASAERLRADITEMSDDAVTVTIPKRDIMLYDTEGHTLNFEGQRLEGLYKLCTKKPKIAIVPIESFLEYTVPKDELINRAFTLKEGNEISLSKLRKKLISCGYIHTEEIDGQGQFSIRGGIADIYPFSDKEPTRIELFGDEVDTIFNFDIFTQRRTTKKKSITIIPTKELLPVDDEEFVGKLQELAKKSRNPEFKNNIEEDINLIKSGRELKGAERYSSLIFNKKTNILDYLNNPLIFISEQRDISDRIKGFFHRLNEETLDLLEKGKLIKKIADFSFSENDFYHLIEEKKAVYIDSFYGSSYKTKVYEPTLINGIRMPKWNGSVKTLLEDLKPVITNNYSAVVLTSSAKSGEQLAKDLQKESLSATFYKDPPNLIPGHIIITTGKLSEGYEYKDAKTILVTHGQNYSVKKSKTAKKSKDPNRITSFEELHNGDYVVHSSHGIGIFCGIKSIETDGIEKDYIKIQYAKSDVLYLPVTQLDLLSRYIGAKDEGKVRLNSLGKSQSKGKKST
jgi:transcription-repair coupling factor (superfamily II helicase)